MRCTIVAVRKPERQVRKASHCGSMQKWRSRVHSCHHH